MRFQTISTIAITFFSALNLVEAVANPVANPVAAPVITAAPERRNAVVQERQFDSLLPASLLSIILGGGTDINSLVTSIINEASAEVASLATADPSAFSSLNNALSSFGGFSGIDSILSSVQVNTQINSQIIGSISSNVASVINSAESAASTLTGAAALSTASSALSVASATASSATSSAQSVVSSAASSTAAATKSASAGFNKIDSLPQGWALAISLVAVGLGGGMLRFL